MGPRFSFASEANVVDFKVYTTSTLEDKDAGCYAYLKEDSTDSYYDGADGTFKPFAKLVDGQLPFTEDPDQPGVWRLSVALQGISGSLALLVRDSRTDLFVEGASPSVFYVLNGERLLNPYTAQVALFEHYSGMNALQLLNEKGDPVEGARVRVYLKHDYDRGKYERLLAYTETVRNGYWADPIYVPVGASYTVVYDKPYEISTTTREVVVP